MELAGNVPSTQQNLLDLPTLNTAQKFTVNEFGDRLGSHGKEVVEQDDNKPNDNPE